MAVFIKFDGVTGSATAKDYQGWSEVQHIRFDINRKVKVDVGKKSDRIAEPPRFSHVTLNKQIDSSTNDMFQAACKGQALDQVEIHACATSDKLSPYFIYKLSNVIVAKHETVIAGGGMPVESLLLSFTKIESHYIARDAANKAQAPFITGYNLETAKMM